MRLRKINEHLYYLKNEAYYDRPNLFYIKGDNYSVAIDAGNSKKHVDKFYKELKKNNLPLPEYTIISHWHWDHTFGLKYIHGKSIGSIKTYEKLNEVAKWKWTRKDMDERQANGEDIEMCNTCIAREYKDLSKIEVVNVDEYIEDKKVLDLGNLKIELIPHMSTHSDDALFVYIEGEGIICAGCRLD